MKRSIAKLFATYFIFVVIMMLWKPIFMVAHLDIYSQFTAADWFRVIYEGLPLDLSMAGYLTVIPGLLLIAQQWLQSKIAKTIETTYYVIISVAMAIVLCLDIVLYDYWGTRLDTTPLFYFSSSPQAALASVSLTYIIASFVCIIAVAAAIFAIFRYTLLKIKIEKSKSAITSVTLLLATAMLFIPIRGGFTVATMNMSAVYFSQDQRLNHAAINPMFSFLYSATHQNNFSSQFRYHTAEKADELFGQMIEQPTPDSIPQLFTTTRPDVYLIIMESFSSHLMATLNGRAPVAVNMDSIANDGILFTNCFANGYRTDRALPAVLAAYPSQPTTSIMKDVTKTDNLPSIPRTFKQNGYNITYYYGGDANFTNMHAFLVSAGFDNIISDKDFPINERLSKWGAHDHVVFNRCIEDVSQYNNNTPTLRVIQTSSSHEPFEVPYNNPDHSDIRANAFAYTDSCLGNFANRLKDLGKWENSLLVIVPDHYGSFPKELENAVERHRIPLIFTGGVIAPNAPRRINTLSSQIDIAATLFHQLGINHDDFIFSKNILNPSSPHYAFFVDQSQFGLVTDSGTVVYNCNAEALVYSYGDTTCLDHGKAFLQKLYDDLDQR
ncbi:MAG: sulfatase-like hydrolase/transferase [Muribaculaceae bacterium]|nr:sulfatase-like hydrolase/transferase [Muribaculaceae bacterium]